MEWTDPVAPVVFGSLFLAVGFMLVVVAGQRRRDKLVPALAGGGLGMIGVIFVLLEITSEPPPGFETTLIQRVIEIPIILFTAGLYWWMAGRLRMSFYATAYESAPQQIVGERPKLRKALFYSPVVLFAAWGYSFIAFWISPQPEIGAYEAADPKFFVLALPAALPGMAYLVMAVWVFIKATKISNTTALTIKYGAFAVAFLVWLLNNFNSLLQAWAASHLDNPARRELIDIQWTVQDYMLPVFLISLVVAIVFTAGTSGPIVAIRRWTGKLRQ